MVGHLPGSSGGSWRRAVPAPVRAVGGPNTDVLRIIIDFFEIFFDNGGAGPTPSPKFPGSTLKMPVILEWGKFYCLFRISGADKRCLIAWLGGQENGKIIAGSYGTDHSVLQRYDNFATGIHWQFAWEF